jgi:hypothetical protein
MKARGFENTSMVEFQSGLACNNTVKPGWVFWPRLQVANKGYLKLRGMRDNFIKRLHEQFSRDTYTDGVRNYLKCNDHKNVRNMSFDDLANLDSESVNEGHYNEEFQAISAHEEYVYPEPVQC